MLFGLGVMKTAFGPGSFLKKRMQKNCSLFPVQTLRKYANKNGGYVEVK
jgi:hypothetical protein